MTKKSTRETYTRLLQQRPFISATEAATVLGVTPNYVHTLARARGLHFPVRPILKADDAFFASWTPPMAWIWGILTSRAVCDAESFTLTVPNADRELITKVRDWILTPSIPLIERVIHSISLSVRARGLVKRFASTDLDQIPLQVFPHYIRGRLDATGEFCGDPPFQCWFPGEFSQLVRLRQMLRLQSGAPEARLIKRQEPYWLAWEDPEASCSLLTWLYQGSAAEIRVQRNYRIFCQMRVALGQPLPPGLIACAHCGEYINSRTRHDFQSCWCGRTSIDGGQDYHRVIWDPDGEPPQSVADLLNAAPPPDPDPPDPVEPAAPPPRRKRGRHATRP